MAMVFAADGLDGGEKLLLLAYTNFTDPHGYCWPGEERLAEDTGTSVSTVRRTKKKLIARNLVRSVRRAETSNLARVNLPLLASMARERRAYDDNEVERLPFDGPPNQERESPSDLQTVQSDLYPTQVPDLQTVQSDRDDRSDCSDSQVNLTCGRGQSDLQSISDPSERTISRPSVSDQLAAEEPEPGDGGTDGSQVPRQIGRNPGVELLLAIGAEQPEFLLTGKTLQDQGLPLAGMLLDGWTPEQLRQVIADRPLPDPIRTSVGAVISSRIRDALAAPAPISARAAVGLSADPKEVNPRSARLSSPAQPKSACKECTDPIFLVGPAIEDGLCKTCRAKRRVQSPVAPEMPVDVVAQARASVLANRGKNRVARMP
ncbi:helix-turn-helix domain-containing protein [Streptomyces sp. NPDC047868]|uniref:helix-turn-helix domain-containing protein n=1 Tax=Streptomyces sp. NPDC047868 TaxID=3155480 RepID=UPI0034556883